MREHKETAYQESGRATAPPGVCYASLASSTSENYSYNLATTPPSTNLTNQTRGVTTIQSPQYTLNYGNFLQQKNQASSCNAPSYTPDSNPSYPAACSKLNSSNSSIESSPCTPNYSTSHLYSPGSNYSFCNNLNNNTNNNGNSNNSSSGSSSNICDNTNIDCSSPLKNSSRNQQQASYSSQDDVIRINSVDQSALFNYPKNSKSNSGSFAKYASNQSNFVNFSNNQLKFGSGHESVDLCSEKIPKVKKDSFDSTQKHTKTFKEDDDEEPEINFNFGEWQQFLSKHGTKFKQNSESPNQDLVTDSFIHFLQKKTQEKNFQDNYSYELSDVGQFLLSITSKLKSDEVSSAKKKEGNEESKLMNDFLAKLLFEKDDKRYKSVEERRKISSRREFSTDDSSNDLLEERLKRDAMTDYQEEKSHPKRSSNYNDQWNYANQQEVQNSNNNHSNRRGHFWFGGSTQSHSVGWNPMGMEMSRQTNPYYSNPHGNVMPARAHTQSEYWYNRWNRNGPNMHNAHSRNVFLHQSRTDDKHHPEMSNSVAGFALTGSPAPSDFSKLRNSSRETMMSPQEKSGANADEASGMRSPTARTSTLSCHPKAVISDPLSDLQMLVTSQEKDSPTEKSDLYQQETVDLSAHSDAFKRKENPVRNECETLDRNGGNKEDKEEFEATIRVVRTPIDKRVSGRRDEGETCEKPVELTSKNNDRRKEEREICSSSSRLDNLKKNSLNESENKCEIAEEKEVANVNGNVEGHDEGMAAVEKCEGASVSDGKSEDSIPNQCADIGAKDSILKEEKEPEKKVDVVVESSNKLDKAGDEKDAGSGNKDSGKPESVASTEAVAGEEAKSPVRVCKRRATEEREIDSEKKRTFLEDESQSAKRVEGGEENSDLPTVSSTSAEVRLPAREPSKKTPKRKPVRKSRRFRLASGHSSGSESRLFKKFKSSTKEEGRKRTKKGWCESVVDRRGPFLHVEGSKESPSRVVLINFPKGDDEDEKDRSTTKKQALISTRPKHHNQLDYRGKSKNGLFSSTLSSRYDAHTTDRTWICVFCKKGPHYNTLGDLFGPYVISKEENSSSICDFSGDEKDISDAQKRGGRNKKSLRSNNMVEHFQKMSRKLRRIQSNDSCLIGMTAISGDQTTDQTRYEVWVHEQCAVWSPNVYLVGTRIMGMQEAIWSSVKTMCSKCGAFGANIGCVFRNCPNRSHYHCAKENEWSLEQETFISTCHIHKPRS